MLPFVILFLVGLATALGVYALALRRVGIQGRYRELLTEAGGVTAGLPWGGSWRAFLIEVVGPLVQRFAPGYYVERLRRMLRHAGRPGMGDLALTLALQALAATGAALLVLPLGLLAASAAALAAGAVPVAAVAMSASIRQHAIDAALADTLDLLMASVEAGLALDAAIAMVSKRPSPSAQALNEELARYLQEIQLGVARPAALRNLAEEQAMKAPLKLLFPLLFGIFPAIFVLVLGPAALQIVDAFTKHP